jgi:micrococcal nuclease
VVDGDTLDCTDGRTVRLLLVDAPEMDQAPFGDVAALFLRERAPGGTVLQVETDVELADRYGRVLAYLRTPDGRLLNEEIVRAGMGVVTVYPPNVRHVDGLRAAAEEARQLSRGLWAVNAFACAPADFRAATCR